MLLVFGAITVDFVFPLPYLPAAGDTLWTQDSRTEPGGKGANQAVAAARDGMAVRLAGAVGNDALGALALAGLSEAGVDVRHVETGSAPTGRSAIMVDPQGYTIVITDAGATSLARASQIGDELLTQGALLLLQMETPATENAALILRARARGARVVLNFSPPRRLAAEALRVVDVLICNSPEMAWLGEHLGTGNNPASIHAALGVTAVRMMGAQGCEAFSDAGYVSLAAKPVEMRDTTGVADCFTGVFAASLARGADLPSALRRAGAAAALSTTRVGAQGSMPSAMDTDAALVDAPEATRKQPEVMD